MHLPSIVSLIALFSLFQLTGCVGPYVYTKKSSEVLPEINSDTAVMADGYVLPLLATTIGKPPPRAVVLALHGFNDYSNAFLSLADYLAARNILLICYDQRGFGRTEGRRYWHGTAKLTGDLLTMVRLLKEEYQEVPLFILGDSMGGAVVLASLESLQVEGGYAGVILVAPAVWAGETMPWYQRPALWFFAHLLPWFELSGKGLDIKPSDNIKMLRRLGRDPLVLKGARADAVYGLSTLMDKALSSSGALSGQAMVLYGGHDEIIPRKPICELVKRLARSEGLRWRFVLYENGYHMLLRDLQAEEVHRDIVEWIGGLIEPPDPRQQEKMPSGAGREEIEFLCNE